MNEWDHFYIHGTRKAEPQHPQDRAGYVLGGLLAVVCMIGLFYFLLRGFWI